MASEDSISEETVNKSFMVFLKATDEGRKVRQMLEEGAENLLTLLSLVM